MQNLFENNDIQNMHQKDFH